MMIDGLKDWATLANTALAIGAIIYSWLTGKAKVNEERLKTVDAKLTDHDRRIQAAESELQHLPAKEDVMELKLALAELRGTVGRLDESLNGISRTVRRVEDHLMKDGGR
ncbi:DUF2730 family protein [Roseibium litorale]|uniref:DUF2730 family protein n=1 Tax=Roseibium litorale TaxID=2803841 RepID=A0ABR9CH26_9HYPH|nr:DUF2730 family protein [Roseibium litorale]MBD8890164.1 DUF2730 family protein [Roseibium litorale]